MPSIQLASIDDPRLQPPIREEWQDGALCTQVDPEIFFPGKGGSTVDAKSVCASCDVVMDCLRYAMKAEKHKAYRHGIYGGLAERQRRSIARAMEKDPSLTLEQAYKLEIAKTSKKGNRRGKVARSQELQAL